MRAKEYLRQIAMLDIKINNRIKELHGIKNRVLGLQAVHYDKDPVMSSMIGDRIGNEVASWIDLENEIDSLTSEYIQTKHKILGEIEQLKDPRHVQLLVLRYVECLTFEQIADEMDYSLRSVYLIHGSALQEFERLHLIA